MLRAARPKKASAGLPPVSLGGFYSVVFHDPGRSTVTELLAPQPTALIPLVGTTEWWARVPDFGTSCVCCNVETTHTSLLQTGSGLEVFSTPVSVPACKRCRGHLAYPRWRVWLYVLPLISGLLVVVLGVLAGCFLELSPGELVGLGASLVAVGLTGLAITLVAHRLNAATRRGIARDGHSPWLLACIGPNRFRLITSNRALVERMARSPLFRRVSRAPFTPG